MWFCKKKKKFDPRRYTSNLYVSPMLNSLDRLAMLYAEVIIHGTWPGWPEIEAAFNEWDYLSKNTPIKAQEYAQEVKNAFSEYRDEGNISQFRYNFPSEINKYTKEQSASVVERYTHET